MTEHLHRHQSLRGGHARAHELARRLQRGRQERRGARQASFDACVASNVVAVGYVHAIAHTVGFSHHVPHGAANAMILPHVLDFYGAAAHAKLARLARISAIGGPVDLDAKLAKLAKLFVQRVRDMSATSSATWPW